MRVIIGVLLTLALVTLGQAKSLQLRSVKGGYQTVNTGQTVPEYPLGEVITDEITIDEDEDDLAKDPNWEPTAEDYADAAAEEEEDYGYEPEEDHGYEPEYDYEDALAKDPNWEPTAEDYADAAAEEEYDYDYEPEYDSEEYDEEDDGAEDGDIVYYEDELWSSDDDPDWKPEDHGYDENGNPTDGGEVITDNADDDPDWVPTDEDYEQLIKDQSYDDDVLHEGSGEEDYYSDETEKEAEDRLNDILFNIALILAEQGVDVPGSDAVFKIYQKTKELNLSYEEALQVLTQLQQGLDQIEEDQDSQESQEVDQTLVEIPAQQLNQVQEGIKTKRQVQEQFYIPQYAQRPVQLQDNGQIQQSGQTQHWQVDSGDREGGQIIDQGQVIHQVNPVAVGVEPYHPGVAVSPYEVGSGVEPVDQGGESDPSFIDWLSHGWGHVVNAADTVSDHVGETVGNWGEHISGAVDVVQDSAQSAGESIVTIYYRLKGKLPELREKIRDLFSSFGLMVRRGADYFVQHLSQAANQVQEAEILDTLQQKLAEGNEQVAAFFQLLGEKLTIRTQSQGQTDVDEGLITGDGSTGGLITVIGPSGTEEHLPNLFQDQDVLVELNRLVDSGVITQEQQNLLSQQQQQQVVDYQQQSQQHQQVAVSPIQVQRLRRSHHSPARS